MQKTLSRSNSLIRLVFLVYFYVFMEWLFFATKPSFLNVLKLPTQIEVLFVASLTCLTLAGVFYGCFFILEKVLTNKIIQKLPFKISEITSSMVATLGTVIMVDNFTYTFFKDGILNTKNHQVALYALAVLVVFYTYLKKFSKVTAEETQASNRMKRIGSLSLICLSTFFVIGTYFTKTPVNVSENSVESKELPNILFFASDGIEADKLSIYGYKSGGI